MLRITRQENESLIIQLILWINQPRIQTKSRQFVIWNNIYRSCLIHFELSFLLCVCMCTQLLQSRLTPCDPADCIANQAPLSREFFRQEYWSGLPFPSPENPLSMCYYQSYFLDKSAKAHTHTHTHKLLCQRPQGSPQAGYNPRIQSPLSHWNK